MCVIYINLVTVVLNVRSDVYTAAIPGHDGTRSLRLQ